jgi:hypothetical protein
LHEVGYVGSGTDLRQRDKVYQYEVQGLPEGEEAFIAEMGHRWQLLRTSNGVQNNWTGEYESPEEALAALQQMLAA